MKLLISLLLGLLPILSICQSTTELDNKFGYKDLKFDMPFDTITKKSKARKISFEKEPFVYYEIRNTEYKSFASHVATIYLVQYKVDSSLYAFLFYFDKKDKTEFTDLIVLFTSLYGEPTEKDVYSYIYNWKGSLCEITLKYDYLKESTTMELISNEVLNKIDAANKKKIDKVKKEF